jgi:catechol 2,3-dioxygenase-like lactoylglutathione lyase family enzyme
MEATTIDLLLRDFESGKVSRRQLIQSIAVLGAAAALPGRPAVATPAPAPAPAPNSVFKGFKTVALDHISYQVKDYRVTRDFYADLMGMTVSDDDPQRTQCYLHFGEVPMVIARNRRARRGETLDPNAGPRVDHIAYRIESWNTDAVKAELESRGLTPRLDRGALPEVASFHVADPDGFDLQISGVVKEGDSLYGQKP